MDRLIPRRALFLRRWRPLMVLVASTPGTSATAFLPQTTALSILGDAVLPPNLCQAPPEQLCCSSIPSSFVIQIRGQNVSPRPRKNRRWPGPTAHNEISSALGFWTRVKSEDEIVDNIVSKGLDVRLSDDGGVAAADDQRDGDAPLQNSALESDGEEISVTLSNSSTETDQSQITTIDFNATENMGNIADDHIGNNGEHRDITIDIDVEDAAQNNRSWWKRISSMAVVVALLPGKPLFMRRLIPIKSSEIISKIMEEMPVQSDDALMGEDEVVPSEGEESDVKVLNLEDEDPEATSSYNKGRRLQGEGPTSLKDPTGVLDKQTHEAGINSHQVSDMKLPLSSATTPPEMVTPANVQDHEHNKGSFFQRRTKSINDKSIKKRSSLMKEGSECRDIDQHLKEEGLKSPKDLPNISAKQENETGSDSNPTPSAEMIPPLISTENETATAVDVRDHKRSRIRRFFCRRPKSVKDASTDNGISLSKEELNCPVIATNIHDLQTAVLMNKVPLRDVGFRFPVKGVGSELILGTLNGATGSDHGNGTSIDNATVHSPEIETVFFRDDPAINGSLSSLTSDAKSLSYQRGIELVNLHPVLSMVRERVEAKSKPGDRLQDANSPEDTVPHLALVIEGGGMRGAVSAGMAAALSTLDLLDAFDSIHGSSAGAIVGAYLVSRQLCTDIYTDIMPAAGSQFASKRRGAINFGVDWLGDVIQRKLLASPSKEERDDEDPYDELEYAHNTTSWRCDYDDLSSVELAMGRRNDKQMNASSVPRRARDWSDDHYDGVMVESVNFLLSNTFSIAKSSIFGLRRLGRILRPALSAFDLATTLSQYLRHRPGMNLTYVLDGIMDETHGLRPFDIDAFRANDKRQTLYVIASTVSNGGRGDMETIAFNSKDGDFFGSTIQENRADSASGGQRLSWYRRIWMMFKYVPYSIFSTVRKRLFIDIGKEFSPPMKDTVETEAYPPGTKAMTGFASRQRIRKLSRPQEEKVYDPTGPLNDGGKNGIFSCLEASMNVPGAAGPPTQLIRSMNRKFIEPRNRFPRFRSRKELNRRKESNSHLCFDAFCYEPIPYRSAVEVANATHVLALRSRPDGCVVETRQHMYERVVGPIYFRKHGMNQVAKLFSSGGSQYIYCEDVLTLNEGLARGISMGLNDTASVGDEYSKGVKVPPRKLFFGNDKTESPVDTDDWKRAHLLPITLPFGTPELPPLSQDKNEVLRAVRNGYATAFDVLAPIAGLPFDSSIQGEKVAELLFPDGDDIDILNKPVKVKPSLIGEDEEETKRRSSFAAWIRGKREAKRKAKDEIILHPDGALARRINRRTSSFHETDQYVRDGSNTLEYIETEALLASLPGFRGGRLDHIADNLLANEERKRKN